MRGMQTSTEDILLAYTLLHHRRLFPSIKTPLPSDGVMTGEGLTSLSPMRYVDLGCGIGSTLLIVDYWLRPMTTVGELCSIQLMIDSDLPCNTTMHSFAVL